MAIVPDNYNIQLSNKLYGKEYEEDYSEEDYSEEDYGEEDYCEEDYCEEDYGEEDYISKEEEDYQRHMEEEIAKENYEVLNMEFNEFQCWNDRMNQKYNKLTTLLEKFDFCKKHPNFTIHGGWVWIDSSDKYTEEEKKAQFDEYLSFARKKDIEKKERDDRFECECMNWLFHRNIKKFNMIKNRLTKDSWLSIYLEEKKNEKKEIEMRENEKVMKIASEKKRQKDIKKGYCYCENGNVCTCGGARNYHNYTKKLRRKIEMGKKRKKQIEEAKQKKIKETKERNRQIFLEKKQKEEENWKNSIEYQIELEKAESRNKLLLQVLDETDDDDESDEEKEAEREEEKKHEDDMKNIYMVHLIKKEEKEKKEQHETMLREIEEKTWKKVCVKQKKTKNKIPVSKKELKMSLLTFNTNDYSNNDKKKKHVLMCTKVCQSVGKKTKCKYGEKCCFAHDINQLRIIYCKFNRKCRHGNRCAFKHEYENLSDYYKRQGFEIKIKNQNTQPKIKKNIKIVIPTVKRGKKRQFRFFLNGEKSKLSFRDVLIKGLKK
jgi:hypothetical protein